MSSSNNFEREIKTLSSSPFVLDSRENEISVGSGSTHLNFTLLLSLQSVSPVVVSLSLATATMAPGPALLIGFCSLPVTIKSWLNLSFDSLFEL